MKMILMCLALFVGPINAMAERPIVHLQPHKDVIADSSGGKTLQLINAPATIHLPMHPPKLDSVGELWVVYIRNLGPTTVTVVDENRLRIPLGVGQSISVYWNGVAYSWKQ